ncbi:hypothetical protein CPB83DRAFT_864753 [Crepidotus variabilis]|uniref:MYND-type domain-containing protein n=1 Tax=Crepidotus variabilis TaxID=179855 RepID=A0A9P6E471_9AGAR|nr:hypothetical protein CPB83DRAFT_864753 [Crepidotus variabilis]
MDIFRLQQTKRPDTGKSKVLWNTLWEKDLKNAYDKLPEQLPDLDMIIVRRMKYLNETSRQAIIEEQRNTRKLYTNLQARFREEALVSLTTQDFAGEWSILTVESRRHHVLEGLYNAATLVHDFEGFRCWCPDMTLAAMADDPQSYLNYLDVLVNGEDTELTYFPNPLFDKFLLRTAQIEADSPEPPELTLTQSVRQGRIMFTTVALRRIYLSFKNVEEFYRSDPTKKEKIRLVEPVTSSEKGTLKELKKDLKKAHGASKSGNFCWGCGIPEDRLPPCRTLQACARCKKINRTILYCSRECQKDDWKQGTEFLPHKEICGNTTRQTNERQPRPLDPKVFRVVRWNEIMDQMSLSEEVPGFEDTGNAKQNIVAVHRPGNRLKKSPALLRQNQLIKKLGADYVFIQHPIEVRVRMQAGFPWKDELANVRQRAEQGDMAAVVRMYQILKPMAELNAPKEFDLAKQLEAEYGVILPKCTGQQMSLQDHMDNWELAKKRM